MLQSHPTAFRDMKRGEADRVGNITTEFQDIKAGRRVLLEFPVFSTSFRCNFVSTVVLDSARVASGNSAGWSCAALIVPRRGDKEWVYSSEGGQWQLLASAGVSRLILLFPKRDPVKQVGFRNRIDKLDGRDGEDEELKSVLRPMVLALSPKVLFEHGIPDIPFLNYSDNVARRVEIEVAYSALTGLMMVEDVEMKPECEQEEEASYISKISAGSPGKEQESPRVATPSTKGRNVWRRRLIFQRMPNLIQTEVPLVTYPSHNLEEYRSTRNSARERKRGKGSSSRRKVFQEASRRVKRVVDDSMLVHKYLPPMVAGFVLISPCLDEFVRIQHKAKVLCVGAGGGALPTFLHNQFGFHVKVIDLDEVVLDLARRHFGLKEGPHLEVTAGDGLDAVTMIAGRTVTLGLGHGKLLTKWSSLSDHEPYANLPTSDSTTDVVIRASEQHLSPRKEPFSIADDGKSICQGLRDSKRRVVSTSTGDNFRDETVANKPTTTFGCRKLETVTVSTHWQQETDPRVEIIIVDVDVADARSELSAPPVAFLEPRFLLSARIALNEGGMLVVNVIALGNRAYEDVLEAFAATFEEVYEISLENEARHSVVFALSKPSRYPCLVGPTVDLVQRVVDGQLVQRIRKVKCKSADFTRSLPA